MRNVWCLTNMQKCLILLAFVSYEAVRLWWWGGNCGVVDFEKNPDLVRFRPSPPIAGLSRRAATRIGTSSTSAKSDPRTPSASALPPAKTTLFLNPFHPQIQPFSFPNEPVQTGSIRPRMNVRPGMVFCDTRFFYPQKPGPASPAVIICHAGFRWISIPA